MSVHPATKTQQLNIGVDVGGTKILAVLAHVDHHGFHVLDTVQLATPHGSGHKLVQGILDAADQLKCPPGRSRDEIAGLGVGVPGLVDRQGMLHSGPHIPGIAHFDVAGELRERFAGLVSVANDATNAALAEHRFGAAAGHDNAIVVTQGTGIGGGLIVNGQVVSGANGFAGEPGHGQSDPLGFLCACGMTGCWETVSSGAGLRNLALAKIEAGAGKGILGMAGGDISKVDGAVVAAAANDGDREALDVFAALASWTAIGLGRLVSLLDPSVIVLGGGLGQSKHLFLDQVRLELPKFVTGSDYRPSVPVLEAALGPSAGAIGGVINVSETRSYR